MLEKPTRGGSRPGAGRKPRGEQVRRRLNTTLTPEVIAAIERRAQADGISLSEALDRCITEWMLTIEIGLRFPPPIVVGSRTGQSAFAHPAVAEMNKLIARCSADQSPAEIPDFPPEDATTGVDLFPEDNYRDFTRDFSYILHDYRRRPRKPERLAALLQKAVTQLRLFGHAKKLKEDLAWKQIQSHVDNDRRVTKLDERMNALVEVLVANWADFTHERLGIILALPDQAYYSGLCWADLSGPLGGSKEIWLERLKTRTVNWEDPKDPENEGSYEITALQEFYSEEIKDAVAAVLRERGLLKGPCFQCEFPSWLVSYKDPRSPGRPTLDMKYCPACCLAR
jgi:hypothetical protein